MFLKKQTNTFLLVYKNVLVRIGCTGFSTACKFVDMHGRNRHTAGNTKDAPRMRLVIRKREEKSTTKIAKLAEFTLVNVYFWSN